MADGPSHAGDVDERGDEPRRNAGLRTADGRSALYDDANVTT
ncbi:hypothetical protein [Natrinema sp. 74]